MNQWSELTRAWVAAGRHEPDRGFRLDRQGHLGLEGVEVRVVLSGQPSALGHLERSAGILARGADLVAERLDHLAQAGPAGRLP
jgi:hypothetical protein